MAWPGLESSLKGGAGAVTVEATGGLGARQRGVRGPEDLGAGVNDRKRAGPLGTC